MMELFIITVYQMLTVEGEISGRKISVARFVIKDFVSLVFFLYFICLQGPALFNYQIKIESY